MPPAQIGAVMGAAQLLPSPSALSLPLILKKLGTGYTLVAAILGVSLFDAAAQPARRSGLPPPPTWASSP